MIHNNLGLSLFSRDYIMPDSPMLLGTSPFSVPPSESETATLINRSPDGQTLMLSSADGYCSIVVFDMSELGAVHATQQHNRQLAAIAQSHSHSHPQSHPHTVASTPTPHSPAISTTGTFGTTRQSPALSRTDREGSTASSITTNTNTNTNYPSQSTSIPLFCPPGSVTGRASSTTSSVDPVLPTPGEESEGFTFPKLAFASGSESGQSTQSTSVAGTAKRAESDNDKDKEGGGGAEVPKKKRRVMLSKVADE